MTLCDAHRAGVCLHITSLPGRFGIGEIGQQAFAFIDAMVRMDLSVWQYLPLGPTAYGNSPYQALSAFAGNELLIDVADLCEEGLLGRDEIESLAKLPRDRVDYAGLIPVKTLLLECAAERFEQAASQHLRKSFDVFIDQQDVAWLHDYVLFRLLKSQHGERPWIKWEQEYVQRDEQPLRAFEQRESRAIRKQKIIQFFFFHQWQRLRDYARQAGVSLFGDMPIYIAHDSADAWVNRELLRLDGTGKPSGVAGVPPDYFSADGQLWGNPLYDWNYHARTGFEWWKKRVRAALDLHDLVRLDHFRGFESFWAVAADADTARLGCWEQGPGDAFLNALTASLGKLPLIAEDLGVITPQVTALRNRHGIPGMAVLQFMVEDPEFDVESILADCVCYTGTHDNDTTMGWFQSRTKSMQKTVLSVTSGSAEVIHHDLIRLAFSTAAKIAIAPLQDYLGLASDARFNTPGTTADNWQWRVTGDSLSNDLIEQVATMVRASGRTQG